MNKLQKGCDTGYLITDSGDGYYDIFITDEKANECRWYEFSSTGGTLEEVEQYLKTHTYPTIVKSFREAWVYCASVEQLH